VNFNVWLLLVTYTGVASEVNWAVTSKQKVICAAVNKLLCGEANPSI
jgi:hypothetical protein